MSIRSGGYRSKGEPILVIICERDTDDPMSSHGAIILEQYTIDSAKEVTARAESFVKSGKHGRVWIGCVHGIKEMEIDGGREVNRLKDVARHLGRCAHIHPDKIAKLIEGE